MIFVIIYITKGKYHEILDSRTVADGYGLFPQR